MLAQLKKDSRRKSGAISLTTQLLADSYINVNLYRPMVVFSGSFAERGQSPKQKALLDQEVAFEKVLGCPSFLA